MPATFDYTGNGNLPSNGNLDERVKYSYNESSALHIDEEDYGNITSSIDLEEDYGSIANTQTIVGARVLDFGSITINETIVPFGTIFTSSPGEISKLVRIQVGEVKFDIIGEAFVFTTPIEFGKGSLHLRGEVGPVIIGLSHRGSGKVVSGIGAATEASVFSYDSSQHTHLGGPPISAEDIVVAANDTEIIDTSSFSNVSVTSGGSGSGSTGGFAIGQHIKYTGNNPRSFSTYPQDLRYYKEIHLTTLIIGTSSNGGENADNGEDFAIEYSTNGGSSFTNIITIDSEDSRFAKSGGGSLILNLPQGAKTANTIVRFRQTSSSGSNFDQYGLSGFTFKADEALLDPVTQGSLFTVGGSVVPKLTLRHVGSGSLFTFVSADERVGVAQSSTRDLFRFRGEVVTVITAGYIGSGTLSGLSGGAEAIGANPQEAPPTPIKIRGTADYEYIQNNQETGSGPLLVRTIVPTEESFVRAEIVSGLLDLNGELAESFGKGNYDGSGTLSGLSGAAEATVFNPQESTALFKITGKAEESATSIFLAAGSTKFGLEEATTTFSLGHIGSVELDINGDVKESRSFAPYIGTGSLFSFVSGDESTTVDLPGKTVRLTVEGTAEQSRVRSYAGEGSFKFGGDEATTTFSLGHIGSVQLDVDGDGAESRSFAPYVAEGSLFGFTGAAESVTFNPVERAVLHTFTGTAVERSTSAHTGSGSIATLRGEAFPVKITLSQLGSGRAFGFDGAAESIAVSPDDTKVLFKVNGNSAESRTNVEIGTGSLFSFVGAGEAVGVVPPTKSALFDVKGEAFPIRITLSQRGSGGIKTFKGSAVTERIAVSPDDTKVLFSFSGSGPDSLTRREVGTGSLFSFGGAAEAVTFNPAEETLLFTFTGDSANAFSVGHIGSGSITPFKGSAVTERIAISPDDLQVLFTFEGSAPDAITRSEVGTGSLFGFTGGDESRLINYAITVGLFAVTGRGLEAFSRANYVGFTESVISGESVDPQGRTPRLIPFRRGRKPQIIVI